MLPGKHYTPEDILRILKRRGWLIALPLAACTAAGLVVLRTMPDLYRSETLILVVPQRVPDSYVRSTVSTRIEDRLSSIGQQIMSRTRLEPIITEFNLYANQRASRPMEDIVERMRRDISVQTVRGDAFRVSYVAPDPTAAQKVTERLASLFIEENLRDREVLAEATDQFLESQLEEARARLVEHEKRLEAYRMRHSGELPTQAQSNLQAVQTLQSQVQALTDSVARDRDRRLILQRSMADLQRGPDSPDAPPRTPATPRPAADPEEPVAGGSAAQQLAAARQALVLLESRLRPEHPDVIRTRRIVADLEVKAEQERKDVAASAAAGAAAADAADGRAGVTRADRRIEELRGELSALDREIAGKESELTRIQGQIALYQSRLDAMPTRESEMIELMRDYDTLRKVYTDLLAKREDSKVAANLERRQIGEQFRVLDPARRPERPVSPNRPAYAAGSAGIGLVLGVMLLVGLEYRDQTFRRDDDVLAALGLPVLATIPRMWTPQERRRRRRLIVFSGVTAVALIGAIAVAGWRLLVR